DEVYLLSRGVVSAIEPAGGLTQLQAVLMEATFDSMTGYPLDLGAPRISPPEFAAGLARRNEAFRTRMLQVMLLGALVLRPLPQEVAERIAGFSSEIAVAEGIRGLSRQYALAHPASSAPGSWGRRRRCSHSTTGFTCFATTEPRSSRSLKCSPSSPGPT